MKTLITTIIAAASAAFLAAGCGKQEVSFDTLEQARSQAKANATVNAQAWRAAAQAGQLGIYSRGDSTQTAACPQGDGWASIDLQTQDLQTVRKLKCSTVSSAVGCLEERDFRTKDFAKQEGNCQPTSVVPFPLPKLTQ